MTDDTIGSFLYKVGYLVDPSEQAKVESSAKALEARITAANAAALNERIAKEKKAQAERIALAQAAGERISKEDQAFVLAQEKERVEAADREKKRQEEARKRQDESFKRHQQQIEETAKQIRAFALKTVAVATGVVTAITGATGGLVYATDRAAKGFERLKYVGESAGTSVKGIKAWSFAVEQLGGSADAAESDLKRFGDQLQTFPQYEEKIKSMGVATRDLNGHMRDAADIAKDLAPIMGTMPRATREAYGEMFGFGDSTLQAMIRPGFGGFYGQEQANQARVGLDANLAGERGAEFERSMRQLGDAITNVKQKIETELFPLIRPALDQINAWVLDHGKAISDVVTKIAQGITDVVTAFAKSGIVKDAMDGISDGLKTFAGYINSGDFHKDMKSFVTDVKAVASALRWALEKLGILPTSAAASVVPEPKGTTEDDASSTGGIGPGGTGPGSTGDGANLHNRRSHKEHQNVDDDHTARVRGQEASFDSVTPTGAHTPLKDLIAQHETGGTGAAGYDTVYGHAEQPGSKMAAFAPPKPITQMTIGEILAYQRDMKGRAGSAAFPVGRAQWVEHTLRGLTAGMDKSTVFTPEVQERLFDKSIAGRMGQGPAGFRSEWDSLRGVDEGTIASAIEGHRKAMAQAAPASGGKGQYPDWMDDRSRREMAAVNAPLARDLLAAAAATGMRFKVAQGVRSQEEANANAQSGRGVRNSQHIYGAAADIHLLDANGNVTYDRAAYQKFADAYTAHSQAGGGQGRWLGNLGGRWGSDIVHFDQGIGYGQRHGRDPYGAGGPTKEDIAANNREIYASPQNPFLHGAPVKVAVTDDSAFKLGKAFVSSSPLLQTPRGSSPNTLGDIHASWQRWAESHNKELVHPGVVRPLGDTPQARASIINSVRHGNTATINHSPTYNVTASSPEAGLKMAKKQGERGAADLVRNIGPMVT